MTQEDELLREVGDPSTPGERPHAVWKSYCDDTLELSTVDDVTRLASRLARNPSLSLDDLRAVLLPGRDLMHGAVVQVAAWGNPSVDVLLLREPLPEYREAACGLLAYCSSPDAARASLEDLVAGWATETASWQGWPTEEEARALAERLAGLFGLPWPSSSSGPTSSG